VTVRWPIAGGRKKNKILFAKTSDASMTEMPTREDMARHIMSSVDWHNRHGTWPIKAPLSSSDSLITLESPENWTATIRGRTGKVVDRVAYDGKPESARNNKISFQCAAG
jgi:hypothetical protein